MVKTTFSLMMFEGKLKEAQFHQLGARLEVQKLGRFINNNILKNEPKQSSFLEFMPCVELVKLIQINRKI